MKYSNTQLIKSRIDGLSTLQEGSTTGDAELIGIRTGYDSTNYSSAGEAVRGQISELHNSINPLSSELADIRTGVDGTYYDSAGESVRKQIQTIANFSIGTNKADPDVLSDGRYVTQNYHNIFQEDENYACSDYILIDAPYCTTGCTYNGRFNTVRSGYALFDENHSLIGQNYAYTYTTISITNENAKYIRVWWNKAECTSPYFVGFSNTDVLMSYTDFKRTVTLPDVETISGYNIHSMNTVLTRLAEKFPDTTSNRVCCWGDSLTHGSGSSDWSHIYPQKLLKLLRNNGNAQYNSTWGVLNNGNAGGGVEEIAAYQGGIVLNVKPTVIPEEGSVQVELEPYYGSTLNMMVRAGSYITSQNTLGYAFNGEKMNPCHIAGVEGNLLRNSNGNFIFTRTESGERVTVNRPTPLITYGASELNLPSDIAVIWAGTNNINMSIDEIILLIRLMIEKLANDKYIIIGLTAKNYHSDIVTKNKKLAQSFGKHFLDVRSYILNYGLQDEGLTPTEEDTAALAQGLMPPSLMHDATHFNDYGYDVVANQVYLKGKSLGYWN